MNSNKTIFKESRYYHFLHHEGADTVTVIFSARNDRAPKFTFWKLAHELRSHIILLNSDVPEWYRAGIPGIRGGIRGAVQEILDFKTLMNAKRLVMIGSSMGAYGALLYGSLAKADEVLAFGIEPLLGVPGGKTEIAVNYLQYMYPDLTQLKLPPVTVYYGGMDLNDILGAWLLKKRNNASLVCIPEAQHDTPDFLSRKLLLGTLFSNLVDGDSISDFNYSTGIAENDDVVKFFWKLNILVVEKNWGLIEKTISENKIFTHLSPLASYLLGISQFRNGNFDGANYNLTKTIERVPGYWEAWMNLGAVNLRLGNFNEAIEYSKNSIKLRPHRSIAHIQLANVYLRAENYEAAFNHAEWACKLNYSRPEYFEMLNKLSTKLNRSTPDMEQFKSRYDENVKLSQDTFANYSFYE